MALSYHRNINGQQKSSSQVTAKLFDLCHLRAMEFREPVLQLAAWRKQTELSQEKLGEKIGYARGYIARVETQDQNVSLSFLIAYAKGVGAPSVEALFKKPEDLNEDAEQLLSYFSSVQDSTAKQTILSVARELAGKSNPRDDDE